MIPQGHNPNTRDMQKTIPLKILKDLCVEGKETVVDENKQGDSNKLAYMNT